MQCDFLYDGLNVLMCSDRLCLPTYNAIGSMRVFFQIKVNILFRYFGHLEVRIGEKNIPSFAHKLVRVVRSSCHNWLKFNGFHVIFCLRKKYHILLNSQDSHIHSKLLFDCPQLWHFSLFTQQAIDFTHCFENFLNLKML